MSGVSIGYIAGAGLGSCLLVLLAITNGMGLMQYLRRTGDDAATSLALGGWVMSVVGLFLGPCALLTGVAAIVISGVERGRVQREEASAWTLIPCQMMRMNGILTILFVLVQVSVVAASFLLPAE